MHIYIVARVELDSESLSTGTHDLVCILVEANTVSTEEEEEAKEELLTKQRQARTSDSDARVEHGVLEVEEDSRGGGSSSSSSGREARSTWRQVDRHTCVPESILSVVISYSQCTSSYSQCTRALTAEKLRKGHV